MIVFNLSCKTCSASFEGWFDSSKDYENQKRKKIINCPSCNSSLIKKSLMAPNISSKTNKKNQAKIKKAMINNINKYKKIVEKNFEYVGDNFTEEAKKIKYGETKERSIYGEATVDQTKELIEEDINFSPLPWSSSKKNN
jgi:hypothetical protein